MVGRYRGFLGYLKKAVPKDLTGHCVVHRQHLVAKNLREKLHESLSTVITAVNKIKANALNSRLFHQLCIENDEDFQCLLIHTEVRRLSKGNCLKRFYTLFNSVLDFFFQESNPALYDKLKSSKTDIAYLTEIFSKFNEVNLQLQDDETSLIKAKSALSAFLSKLQLYSRNLGLYEFRQFPCLSDLEKKTGVKDNDIAVYCAHLAELHRQNQWPIFSWNLWLGDRSVYGTQHRGANPSRRGTWKFAKWQGYETKVQNLLPSLLDANSDPKTLPNSVERHQVAFHCFSDLLPGWEGIQRCVQAPHQTKKQTQHNRAWWDCSWQTFILMLTVWLQCTKPTHLIKQGTIYQPLRSGRIWHKVNF